jgi:hypothetical protein
MVDLWSIGIMLSGAGERYRKALWEPDGFVMAPPSLDQDLGFAQCVENLAIQQHGDHAVSISSELFRQCDNILGKPFFSRQATWHLVQRRTMLAEGAANPALRYAEGLPYMINA